jgi:hypothetical protein
VTDPWSLAALGILFIAFAFASRRYNYINAMERESAEPLQLGWRVMRGILFWGMLVLGVGFFLGGLVEMFT